MSAIAQRLQYSTLTLIFVGLVGCYSPTQLGINFTPVKDIEQKWQRYSTVHIQGRVVDQVPLLESWVYEVQDLTGAIWVLTKQPVPSLGQQVRLKGQVRYQAIPMGSQDLGEAYIVEEVRLKN